MDNEITQVGACFLASMLVSAVVFIAYFTYRTAKRQEKNLTLTALDLAHNQIGDTSVLFGALRNTTVSLNLVGNLGSMAEPRQPHPPKALLDLSRSVWLVGWLVGQVAHACAGERPLSHLLGPQRMLLGC